MNLAFIEGVGGSELILVLLAALLLFGSKNLPKVARGMGRTLEGLRRSAREVKDEIMKADLDPAPPPPAPPRITPAAHLAAPEAKEKVDEPSAG